MADLKSTEFSKKSTLFSDLLGKPWPDDDPTLNYLQNEFGPFDFKDQRRSGIHKGLPPVKALSGSGVHDGGLLARAIGGCVLVHRDRLVPLVIVHSASLRAKAHSDLLGKPWPDDDPTLNYPQDEFRAFDFKVQRRSGIHKGLPPAKALSGSGVHDGGLLAAILSNQGESSGSGGKAGEERNGGGGDGNQGIGGGVGGGGQREGIGNERRGSRGRSHGGGNGDDDDNDRGGWVGYIEGERRPMDPRPDRMAEMLLALNVQVIAALESLDVTMLSARARILRVVSLGFNSGALVCFSASIRQRGTNPRLASILSWIGSVATFLGFISMIAMALLASFIP